MESIQNIYLFSVGAQIIDVVVFDLCILHNDKMALANGVIQHVLSAISIKKTHRPCMVFYGQP